MTRISTIVTAGLVTLSCVALNAAQSQAAPLLQVDVAATPAGIELVHYYPYHHVYHTYHYGYPRRYYGYNYGYGWRRPVVGLGLGGVYLGL